MKILENSKPQIYKEASRFKLESKYKPSGDQPQAIKKLVENLNNGEK